MGLIQNIRNGAGRAIMTKNNRYKGANAPYTYHVTRGSGSSGGTNAYLDHVFAFQGGRDILAECKLNGPYDLYQELESMFLYVGIAQRLASIYPKTAFSKKFEIDGGGEKFQREVEMFIRDHRLVNKWTRAAIMNAYSGYSVFHFVVQDGLDQDEPAGRHDKQFPLIINVYSQKNSQVSRQVMDMQDFRYGLPEEYSINVRAATGIDNSSSYGTAPTSVPITGWKMRTHHSRIVHFPANQLEHQFIGEPNLKKIYHNIHNLLKVDYSAAEEWFQRTAAPIILSFDKDVKIGDADKQRYDMGLQLMLNGFQKGMAVKGGSIDALQLPVNDPTNHVNIEIQQMCGSMETPFRLAMGSEIGQLASTQDAANFFGRVDDWRHDEADPKYVRPTIKKAIEMGFISEPQGDWDIIWPDLMETDPKDVAETALKTANAIKVFGEAEIPLMTPEQFCTERLGIEYDQAALEKFQEEQMDKALERAEMFDLQDGGQDEQDQEDKDIGENE